MKLEPSLSNPLSIAPPAGDPAFNTWAFGGAAYPNHIMAQGFLNQAVFYDK
jgi:hypothetical protein